MQMIEDCENRESKLTDWERGFIDSLRHATDKGYSLTEKQVKILEEIWDKVT